MKRIISATVVSAFLAISLASAAGSHVSASGPGTESTHLQAGPAAARPDDAQGVSVERTSTEQAADTDAHVAFGPVRVPAGVAPAAVSGAKDVKCPATAPCGP